jgi:small subunit ribosomal protein S20
LPKIKSAIKRVEVTERNRLRNIAVKSRVRTAMKKCLLVLKEATPAAETVKTAYSTASSLLDRAATKGVMHKKTISRYKSRLAKRCNKALVSA